MIVRVALRRPVVCSSHLTFLYKHAFANTRVRQPLSTQSVAPTPKRFLDDLLHYWKKWIGVRIGIGVVVLCGCSYILSTESEAGMIRRAVTRFEDSTVDEWSDADAEATISRTNLESTLVDLIQVADSRSLYSVVVGASGTGKSTATRKAIRSIKGNKGVVYFLVPDVHTFSTSLALTVGYRPPRHLWDRALALLYGYERVEPAGPPQAHEPLATWLVLQTVLVKAASEYKRKHGLAPCLVLDSMDIVARDNEHLFRLVQNFAKMCADKRILRVVFVFSDGTALPLLESNSAVSRADESLEVGDLTDAEAIAYLDSTLRVPHERAKEMVQSITGGRLSLLNKYGSKQVPIASIKQRLDAQTEDVLLDVGILPSDTLFETLVDATNGKVIVSEAHKIVPAAKTDQLLRRNIILQHPDKTYSFHSRNVEVFMRQKVEEHRRRSRSL